VGEGESQSFQSLTKRLQIVPRHRRKNLKPSAGSSQQQDTKRASSAGDASREGASSLSFKAMVELNTTIAPLDSA